MVQIYICYGITKSASTFTWQLVKRIALAGGLPVATLTPKSKGTDSPEDYIDELYDKNLELIKDDIGDLRVVIKTHGDATPAAVRLVAEGTAQVFASYRDLRDVALSLLDHGARSRAEGTKDFSEFHELADTLEHIKVQVESFENWVQSCEPLLLSYDEVCFNTRTTISKIAERLEVSVDLESIFNEFNLNRPFIGQFNKGKERRFEQEMDVEASRIFVRRFQGYYQKYFPLEYTAASTVQNRGIYEVTAVEVQQSHMKLENFWAESNKPRYSVETAVEALYRGILARLPDEKGFLGNIRRLTFRGSKATDLAPLFKDFLLSEEYQNKAARQFAQSLIASRAALNDEPAEIVSLGSHCLVSHALKEMGLKRYSCPFDWIFSRPSMVEHCIKDSFATLVDCSQYEPVIDGNGIELSGKCHHAFYRSSFGVESVFNHRDMRIKVNYEYLLRCIDRFTKLLASLDRKVFVILSPASQLDSDDFFSLYNTLSRVTSNFNLTAVALEQLRNYPRDFGIDYVTGVGSSCLLAMRRTSNAGPLAFEDPFDDFLFRRAIITLGVQVGSAPLVESKMAALP